MQGGSFTISSLGGIGGTAFTPDHQRAGSRHPRRVALQHAAGVDRRQTFVPRLMLPLSLSYDHRVIDGADGARFTDCAVRRRCVDVTRDCWRPLP